jgi:hypothetical protein
MPQSMSEQYAPPSVTIRRYRASDVCDVVVAVRGQKMVLRCPDYPLALKCARLECRSYNVPKFLELPDNAQSDELPSFLRSPGNRLE